MGRSGTFCVISRAEWGEGSPARALGCVPLLLPLAYAKGMTWQNHVHSKSSLMISCHIPAEFTGRFWTRPNESDHLYFNRCFVHSRCQFAGLGGLFVFRHDLRFILRALSGARGLIVGRFAGAPVHARAGTFLSRKNPLVRTAGGAVGSVRALNRHGGHHLGGGCRISSWWALFSLSLAGVECCALSPGWFRRRRPACCARGLRHAIGRRRDPTRRQLKVTDLPNFKSLTHIGKCAFEGSAAEQDGRALEFADNEFQKDHRVVLAAVQTNGSALEFADEKLRADTEVALAAVNEFGGALQFAGENPRVDRDQPAGDASRVKLPRCLAQRRRVP